MIHDRSLLLCTCLSVLLGCGDDAVRDPAPADDDSPVEDFPEVPTAPPGARVIELAEQVIPPGSEVQLCHFLQPEAADVYVGSLEAFQGANGHHLLLFRALQQETPGTVRDCTKPEDMINLVPVVIAGELGNSALGDGAAIRVPAGTQLVVQQHYVNAGERPLRVRDALHLGSRAKEEVALLIGFYSLASIGLSLTPEADREQTVTFSCEAPRAMNLRMMAPHMHEEGARISVDLIRAGAEPERLIEVDPWSPAYRDHPPANVWEFATPLSLAAGDRIETTCVYRNRSGRTLTFPTEMCVTLGYFFPATEGTDNWTCVEL